ncbi:MAG: serine/threonine-protein kinase [Candidatus Brocadiia bacterium]
MRAGPEEPTEITGGRGGGADEGGAPAPTPGQSWGKFLIEKRLGGGGQAEVYQAFDQMGTCGHVALKVPVRPLPPEQIQRWVDTEAGALLKLNHPNVVQVVDAGRVGRYPYVATELVDALPMNEYVRANPPSERQAVDWMLALTDAVQAAHTRGIVHRDLKPLNVLITREGKPLLIDFGLASMVTAYQTEPRRDASGTYPFMAPEQARGEAQADHRVDVFALGALLKYLLVGTGPYSDTEHPVRAAREGEVVHLEPSGTPLRRRLCGIANRALSPDPRERYQTVKELHDALRKVKGRHWKWLALSGALVAAAVVGLWLVRGGMGGPVDVEANLNVEIQRGGQGARFRPLRVDLLPVRPTDRIRVSAHFSEPLYAYVAAAGPDGVRLLYPAHSGRQEPVTDIRLPDVGGLGLAPPQEGGTRTVILLGCATPVPDPGLVAGQLDALGRAPRIRGVGLFLSDGLRETMQSSGLGRLVTRREATVDPGLLRSLAEQVPQRWAVAFTQIARRAPDGPEWRERMESHMGHMMGTPRSPTREEPESVPEASGMPGD